MPEFEEKIPPYLRNTKEVTVPVDSCFSGKIPAWLQGNLLTSSPGLFDLDNGSVINWFDGYAIISNFVINGPKVTFTSKYLQSSAYRKAHKAQKPIMPEFGTPPSTDKRKSLFSSLVPFGPYDVSDNCVGSLFKFGANLYTACDTPYFHEIDPNSLETVGTFHTLKAYGMSSVCPQPVVDNDNGDVYLIGSAIHPTFRYTLMKMSAQNRNNQLEKRFEAVASFPSRWLFGASPCRSFGITRNYIIFIEMPLVLNIMKLAATNIKGYSSMDWLDWRPEDGVRFILIKKGTGEVIKTDVYAETPFVTPFVVNAYEDEDGEIIIDLISYPNTNCNLATTLSTLRWPKPVGEIAGETGTLHRYIIPGRALDIKQCPEGRSLLKSRPKTTGGYSTVGAIRRGQRLILTPEPLSELGQGFDFAAINGNYRGKDYSFVYNTSGYISNSFSPYAYGLTKTDVRTKEALVWRGTVGQVLSEPVFVPNPVSGGSGAVEDEGILLTVVKSERSYEEDPFLLALDPKTMEEIGRAYFKCPIPGWFHATFFSS